MTKWRILQVFSSKIQGEVAKSFLESHGISARLLVDDVGGTHPSLSAGKGTQLLVEAENFHRALTWLNQSFQ